MTKSVKPLRVLFTCTGVGILNRGIESFFREAFDGINGQEGLELRLLKGAGATNPSEQVIWTLPRTSDLSAFLGKLARRNSYVIEQWSSFIPIARQIRQFRPQVIFYSDSNLGFLLYWFRRYVGVNYRLLFSNGGPCHPPFIRRDFVHQVAPLYYENALRSGEPEGKHFMVPYGINVPNKPPVYDPTSKHNLRIKLGLPLDRQVVLSVGWIAREHKRMHYVIEEVARLPEPRPFLQLLGAIDGNSADIISLGNQLLGTNGFRATSVPYEQVDNYYLAADCFVLGSLQEGFGRVYLEALMRGLPVIAHRHPVVEFVLGKCGTLGNLAQPGELAGLMKRELSQSLGPEIMLRRWENVQNRFSWHVLAPAYAAMFRECSSRHIPIYKLFDSVGGL